MYFEMSFLSQVDLNDKSCFNSEVDHMFFLRGLNITDLMLCTG